MSQLKFVNYRAFPCIVKYMLLSVLFHMRLIGHGIVEEFLILPMLNWQSLLIPAGHIGVERLTVENEEF